MNVKNSFTNIAAELVYNYINKVNEFISDETNKYKLYKKETLNICGYKLIIEDEGSTQKEFNLSQTEVETLNFKNARGIWLTLETNYNKIFNCFIPSNCSKSEIQTVIENEINSKIKYYILEMTKLNNLLSNEFMKQ